MALLCGRRYVDEAPSPNPCQVFARAAHCRFERFQWLGHSKGEDSRASRRAMDTRRGIISPGLEFGRHGLCSLFVPEYSIFRKAKPRKISPAPASQLRQKRNPSDRRRRCPKQAQRRHHRAARRVLQQEERRRRQPGTAMFIRLNSELIRENRPSGATEQRSPFGLAGHWNVARWRRVARGPVAKAPTALGLSVRRRRGSIHGDVISTSPRLRVCPRMRSAKGASIEFQVCAGLTRNSPVTEAL